MQQEIEESPFPNELGMIYANLLGKLDKNFEASGLSDYLR